MWSAKLLTCISRMTMHLCRVLTELKTSAQQDQPCAIGMLLYADLQCNYCGMVQTLTVFLTAVLTAGLTAFLCKLLNSYSTRSRTQSYIGNVVQHAVPLGLFSITLCAH